MRYALLHRLLRHAHRPPWPYPCSAIVPGGVLVQLDPQEARDICEQQREHAPHQVSYIKDPPEAVLLGWPGHPRHHVEADEHHRQDAQGLVALEARAAVVLEARHGYREGDEHNHGGSDLDPPGRVQPTQGSRQGRCVGRDVATAARNGDVYLRVYTHGSSETLHALWICTDKRSGSTSWKMKALATERVESCAQLPAICTPTLNHDDPHAQVKVASNIISHESVDDKYTEVNIAC